MKTNLWLLIVLAFLFLPTGTWPAAAKTVEFSLASGANHNKHFSYSNVAVRSALCYADANPFARDHGSYLPASDDENTPLLLVSDQKPDEDGQADEGPFNNIWSDLVRRDLSNYFTDWRLRTRDTQRANSFIHSKAKPPPYDNHHRQ